MHELPVTQSALEIALRHAEAAEAERVTEVHIVIGDLSSYIDEAVQFYWEILTAGTIAEGSQLRFTRIPAEMECMGCGYRYSPAEEDFACPKCEGIQLNIVSGDEFLLQDIEVEYEEAVSAQRTSDLLPGA